MPDPPHVSVIIIFYDAERFLEEAIESVLSQSYDSWELLLANDGSTDNSGEIAQRYADNHEYIRHLQHPGGLNRGMSATRNLGLQHARGQYITYLDADDVLLPNALEEQTSLLNVHDEAAMAYGPIKWWYSWADNTTESSKDFLEDLYVPLNTLYQAGDLVPSLLRNKIAIPSGMVMRRKAVDAIGGFEPRFTGLFEDQAFCLKFCLHHNVYASRKSWYKYRQHSESCCNRAIRAGNFDYDQPNAAHKNFLDWAENYLREQHVTESEIWSALIMARLPYDHPRLYHIVDGSRHVLNQLLQLWPFDDPPKTTAKRLLNDLLPRELYLHLWRHSQREGPTMETLAIIAFRQPITAFEIEAVQGVDPTPMLNSLSELGLIDSSDDVINSNGTESFSTTPRFLNHFGLHSLDELPSVSEPAFITEQKRSGL